jgi:non-specific serine/threonine protein kinase
VIAAFADGGSLADVRAIADAGPEFLRDLEALVGWSLVRGESTDGDLRLSMLGTVREHALWHAQAEGVLEGLRNRHASRFLELALAAEVELARPDQAAWLNRLEREFDNLAAALEWMLSSGRTEEAIRATAALSRFWRSHGHIAEARRWLALGLEQGDDLPAGIRADALWAAARQAAAQSDWDSAGKLLEEALPLYRSEGRIQETVFTLSELAFIAVRHEELNRAAHYGEEALEVARELGDPRAISGALLTVAETRSSQGEHARALEHSKEVVALRRQLGDPLLVTDALHNQGWVAFLAGDYALARASFDESLDGARRLGDALHTAEALRMLGELDLFDGDPDAAEPRIRESIVISTEVGSDLDRAAGLIALGGVETLRGRFDEAAGLFAEALWLRRGAPFEAPERAVLDRFSATRSETPVDD